MKERKVSEKQERARAYNRANGRLKGLAIQLDSLRMELPYIDLSVGIRMNILVKDIQDIRLMLIEHQNKLIEEGK